MSFSFAKKKFDFKKKIKERLWNDKWENNREFQSLNAFLSSFQENNKIQTRVLRNKVFCNVPWEKFKVKEFYVTRLTWRIIT